MPRRADMLSAFLRSFAIQGSWNYRTMIGAGMAYALSPLLQRIHAGDPVALRGAIERHAAEFNAHPYLSSLAIGALARLEHEGADPDTLARFRAALRAPLGAIGDRAVWAGWRPFCIFSTILAYGLGADPIAAALGFLLVYNLGHIALRGWGLRWGWEAGLDVGQRLKTMTPLRLAGRLVPFNQALMAACGVVLLSRLPGPTPEPWMGAVAAVAGLGGYLAPGRLAGPAVAGLFAAWLLWAW